MMGFTPQQVDRMTLWQFAAALRGWRIGNGMDKPPAREISDADLADMGIVGF